MPASRRPCGAAEFSPDGTAEFSPGGAAQMVRLKSAQVQRDHLPARPGRGRDLFDAAGDGVHAFAPGVVGGHLRRGAVGTDRLGSNAPQSRGADSFTASRGADSFTASRGADSFTASRRGQQRVYQRAVEQWPQLGEWASAVDDFQHPPQRRVGEDRGGPGIIATVSRRACAARCSSRPLLRWPPRCPGPVRDDRGQTRWAAAGGWLIVRNRRYGRLKHVGKQGTVSGSR